MICVRVINVVRSYINVFVIIYRKRVIPGELMKPMLESTIDGEILYRVVASECYIIDFFLSKAIGMTELYASSFDYKI